MSAPPELPPTALLGGLVATGLRDVTSDLGALDSRGWWAVVVTFEGDAVCARFDDVRPAGPGSPGPALVGRWLGPPRTGWTSSLSRDGYVAAVERVREHVAAGDVYQANVCRVLSAPLPDPAAADVVALHLRLAAGNPAPHGGAVRLPEHGVHVATASPELYLSRRRGADGDVVRSRPIKGTGRSGADVGEKDRAENVMIVDLVRNDLGAVCATGSVTVPELCVLEQHPGLVHLVSTVQGRLADGVGWAELLDATFPPGSVSGAPKRRALEVIGELEPVPRGPYCGAVGWVDADRGEADLAVGIRTFWLDGPRTQGRLVPEVVRFGAGAGITWSSDPVREWDETGLKAAHLLAVAEGAGAVPVAAAAGATGGARA